MNNDQVIEKAKRILRKRVHRTTELNTPARVREWLSVELSDLSHEHFHVTYLDSQHRVIADRVMFEGTIDGSAVYPRRVVEESLNQKASAVIFCHNHPSGVNEPSQADKRITERLTQALALIDVRVLDHFIVSGGDSYSMAENGLI